MMKQANQNRIEVNADSAIGVAVRDLRSKRGMTARELAQSSGISAAMISRIESGQVSPSISTLQQLSNALNVPLINLFRGTAGGRCDFTHVRSGEGIKSKRIFDGHVHDYVNLALHARWDIQFEARQVKLTRQDVRPPEYIGSGVVFVYILSGSAIYQYGEREVTVEPGDSLCLDAEMNYGFKELLTEELEILTVQAERRN